MCARVDFKLTEVRENGIRFVLSEEFMKKNVALIRHAAVVLLWLICVIVRADEPWMLNTLAQFDLISGQNCWAGLAKGLDGNFYGVSLNGGTNGGYGTVFRLTTNGNLVSIFSFNGTNGSRPQATLLCARDGNLYGCATYGGVGFNGGAVSGMGTLFRVSPVGEFTILQQFNGTNGAYPAGPLMEASDGLLYGTTTGTMRGAYPNSVGKGTIFSLSTNGEFSTCVVFGGTNGDSPSGKLLEVGDSLYGTCYQGGESNLGTIFRFNTNGSLMTVASFAGSNGAWPLSGLVRGPDGQFYGATSKGGNNAGTVYRLTTNGFLTTLHAFNGTDGNFADASLALGQDGALYGTTASGGSSSISPASGNVGTIYKITTNGLFTSLLGFNNLNGVNPIGELIADDDGSFYGTTSAGGSVGGQQVGGVFRYGRAVNPVIFSAEVGGFEDFPIFEFKWHAFGGVRYGVQVNSTLDPLGWTYVPENENPVYTWRSTEGELSTYLDFSLFDEFLVGQSEHQFFRLVVLPP